MRNSNRLQRCGVFAMGLGVAAAMASLPAIANADSVDGSDALVAASYLPDFGAVAAAAAAATPPTAPDAFANYAISFSGYSLFDNGTASATSTFGGLAIAHGDFASATATSLNYASATGDFSSAQAIGNGLFNQASATGFHSLAQVIVGTGNVATATGDESYASAGWAIPNGTFDATGAFNFNTATAEGYSAEAYAGGVLGDSAATGSNNVASAIGDNAYDVAPSVAAGASGNWLTELLASFDGGSAASESADFWAELTTLF